MELLNIHSEIEDEQIVEFHAWGVDSFGEYRSIYGNVITPKSRLYTNDGLTLSINQEQYREEVKRALLNYSEVAVIDRIDITVYEPVERITFTHNDEEGWHDSGINRDQD